MKTEHQVYVDVLGPWSLATSKRFWEGFTPAALALAAHDPAPALSTVFRVDADWSRAKTEVTQQGSRARIVVRGDGDLDAAASQVCRFLGLDVDARSWPDVARRDPVLAEVQAQLPGFRPCGFHSPYEAAVWSVLSQRIRIVQAARLRQDLVERHGDAGAFPAPQVLLTADLPLPGRKAEYLRAVAAAALDGQLDGRALRSLEPAAALAAVQEIKGLGPFAAQLVVVRGANTPDAPPRLEPRLETELLARYGPDRTLAELSEAWRPFRSWAVVHLRALGELRRDDG